MNRFLCQRFLGCALLATLAGCSSQDARITSLETAVKANSDKIAEQGKAIEMLKTAQASTPAPPDPTTSASPGPTLTATPSATPSSTPTPTPTPSETPKAEPTPNPASVRSVAPLKSTNGRVAIWVTQLAEYHGVADLGLRKLDKAEEETAAGIQADLAAKNQKIVVLWINMSNASSQPLTLGCGQKVGPLFLSGGEGNQFSSAEEKSLFLTEHIGGGFPRESLTPPKAVVGGRLCFVVSHSTVPSSLFPADDAHLGAHPDALTVKLK